ncbi:MAG: hypothetical protein C0501_16825 [Isosphaera sp.]|nr:hypothetical protein [Isosphaera sp.]
MSPDDPFLRALLADPDDDTLRLALADWLDEHDDAPRAEFVRVQLELARGVVDRGRRCELEVRQRDLLVAHDADWVRPLAEVLGCRPGEWGGWVFRRGFVEYFRLEVDRLVAHGAALAALTPLRELTLEGRLTEAAAEVLVAAPYLDRLRGLYQADVRHLSRGVRRRFLRRFGAALRPG